MALHTLHKNRWLSGENRGFLFGHFHKNVKHERKIRVFPDFCLVLFAHDGAVLYRGFRLRATVVLCRKIAKKGKNLQTVFVLFFILW